MNKILGFRSLQEWVSSLPVFLLLLTVVIAGNGEQVHLRLLQIGEHLWQDYFLLRADIPTPTCNPDPDLEVALKQLQVESEQQDDDLEALFDEEPFDKEAALSSLQRNKALCLEKHQIAQQNQARVTPSVQMFRGLETSIAVFGTLVFEKQRMMLVLMLFICAVTCTIKQQHISFKPIITINDHWVSTVAQLLGNTLLLISAWFYRDNIYQSASVIEHAEIYLLLILGFAALVLVNLYQLFKTKKRYKVDGRLLHAALAIPLYIYMAFFAANYFFLVEDHWAGLAIFFSLLVDQAGLFLNIGLYIWVGMLLKRTQLGEMVFNVFVPWRMSPELLAVAAIIVMAVPTAYTGASGIIIIAMGAIVYQQLRHTGARKQLALATTAMTGSAGVVLRPCLLVVLIAALNKEVVTDQLFDWGLNTFFTTVAVFLCLILLTKKQKIYFAPMREAFKPFLKALVPLIPYVLIVIVISMAYSYLLNIHLDEFSAPIILPGIILVIIAYEKIFSQRNGKLSVKKRIFQFESGIRMASSDSSVHIGALLLLMGLSFVSGGVIERSDILSVIPEVFSSVWLALGFLVLILVAIGMFMDPFGAVVLVSSSIAQIAYSNGINPVHFWMITLVAFELGYLTPPVALNHLLTRQMVGYKETLLDLKQDGLADAGFWYRHERILLPLTTLGITLLLVAIVPVWLV